MISPQDPRYPEYVRLRAQLFDKPKRDRASGRRYSEEEIDREIAATPNTDIAHAANRHTADAAHSIDRAKEARMADSEPIKCTDGASEAPIRPSGQSDETPEYPSAEQLDEDEAMLRALRIDLPGTAGAPSGIIAITCTNRLPKKEFFRCGPSTIVMNLVDHAAGMEVE
jgi:hypothetical protein